MRYKDAATKSEHLYSRLVEAHWFRHVPGYIEIQDVVERHSESIEMNPFAEGEARPVFGEGVQRDFVLSKCLQACTMTVYAKVASCLQQRDEEDPYAASTATKIKSVVVRSYALLNQIVHIAASDAPWAAILPMVLFSQEIIERPAAKSCAPSSGATRRRVEYFDFDLRHNQTGA